MLWINAAMFPAQVVAGALVARLMNFPPRVVYTILATIGFAALAVVAIVHLRHRHRGMAIAIAVGAVLAIGWALFVLPAYWD